MVQFWNIVLWNCTQDHKTLRVDFHSYKYHFNTILKSHLKESTYIFSPSFLHRSYPFVFSSFCTYVSHYTVSVNGITHPSRSIFNIIVWKSNFGPDQTHDLMIPFWNIILWNCTPDHDDLRISILTNIILTIQCG